MTSKEINKNNLRSLLWVTAGCSLLGAITTALLMFLPAPQADGFEQSSMLFSNDLYMSRLWILYLHPQFNLIASIGVAFLLFRKYPLQISLGTLFLFMWSYTEMTQQALLIDALNQIWRPAYVVADEGSKETFKTLLLAASGISDSKYFVVIYCFGLGSLLFGLAFVKMDRLGKIIGYALLLIGTLSLASFFRYYLGAAFLDAAVDWVYTYIYPYLQPAVRVAIGYWIILQINNSIDIAEK